MFAKRSHSWNIKCHISMQRMDDTKNSLFRNSNEFQTKQIKNLSFIHTHTHTLPIRAFANGTYLSNSDRRERERQIESNCIFHFEWIKNAVKTLSTCSDSKFTIHYFRVSITLIAHSMWHRFPASKLTYPWNRICIHIFQNGTEESTQSVELCCKCSR